MKYNYKLKQRFIKLSFIIIIFFIFLFLTLLTSSNINYQQPFPNTSVTNKPETTSSKPTNQPFIPNQELDEQQRFLVTMNHQILNPPPNTYEHILLKAYGAVFINQQSEIKLPTKVILETEEETQEFQESLQLALVKGTKECYLQKAAAEAFNQARLVIDIPLKSGYSGDCTRSFQTTVRFWQKYTNNRTLEQVKQGKETKILNLVAPPGTSQHLWGLALDLGVSKPAQREALNQNGWFQTVENDQPHWTYLGWNQEDLLKFGLKDKIVNGITYWLTPI